MLQERGAGICPALHPQGPWHCPGPGWAGPCPGAAAPSAGGARPRGLPLPRRRRPLPRPGPSLASRALWVLSLAQVTRGLWSPLWEPGAAVSHGNEHRGDLFKSAL